MPDIILPKDHISITSASDLTDICAPLFRYTDIDAFGYFKAYPDNSLIALDTYLEWHEYMFNSISDIVFTWDFLDILANNKNIK